MRLFVGQKLYLTPSKLDKRANGEPREVTVENVGRKYFKLKEFPRTKYSIETLTEENNINYKAQCYTTLQEILDLRDYDGLLSKIKSVFSYYGQVDISLSQLRQINDILFKHKTQEK